MFYVTAAVYTLGAIMYCILASGAIQPWAIESVALQMTDSMVVEVELHGRDTLLCTDKPNSSSVPHPSLEHNTRDDTTADTLLTVNN